ncbi:MAG: CHAT domain-containing tetratricopeptide repeat protein [Ktedonobacteraceae bacterium]
MDAVREAFVDRYGGLALDLPPWLEEVEDQYDELRYSGQPHQTAPARLALLQAALDRAGGDPAVAPETVGDLLNKFAIALKEHPLIDRARAIDAAIAAHEAALHVFTADRYPRQWALHQTNLGNAYGYRVTGERRKNLEAAIGHFTAALQVYNPAEFPQQYATTMHNLGVAYQDRIEGERREDLELSLRCLLAALRIRTRTEFPTQHASTLNSLGIAYHERVAGSRQRNLEKAIACYRTALRIYTLRRSPADHAMVCNSLGLAYQDRVAGNRRENLEEAIACFNAALQVYTSQSFPSEWAATQHNLGVIYAGRLLGARRDNLEEAIVHYANALQVRTPENFPLDYAETLDSLGSAYKSRLAGERRENLQKAVTCYTRALEIRTLEAVPRGYAATQNNLGGTYWLLSRLPGDRLAYVEEAITCYAAALQVYSQADSPVDYAMVQSNLGVAYWSRMEGEPAYNQEEAIACYTRALQVYTPAEFPVEYAATQDNLGIAYWRRMQGERQKNLETAFACHTRALEIYTLAEFPVEYRNVHLNLASLAFEELADAAQRSGDTLQLRAAYVLAQQHFALARQAQLMLGWLESDEQGRASLQGAHHATREMYAREAWCLLSIGKLREAAAVLEAGRVQALVEAQTIAVISLDGLCQEHAAAFEIARQQLQLARAEGERVQLRSARDAFLQARLDVRAHCKGDFLPDMPTYQEIARAAAPEQALVYLAATHYGGFALVVPPALHHPGGDDRPPIAIPLPHLTWQVVDDWIVTPGGGGGYQFALRRQGLALLLSWLASDKDQEEYGRRLATPLRDIPLLIADSLASLRAAVVEVPAHLGIDPRSAPPLSAEQPLEAWLADGVSRNALGHYLAWSVQKAEVEQVTRELGVVAMAPLRAGLDALGLGSRDQRLAIVPCGRLGVFPLHAAPVDDDKIPFWETCELSYQASARTLAAARSAAEQLPAASALLAVGNPGSQGGVTLPCAGKEARAIARLARQRPGGAGACLQEVQATRALFLKKLGEFRERHPGAWVHIAGHGRASVSDPHESYMEFAGFDAQGRRERLSLAMLQRERLLVGIWGVTASGCVTGLSDLEVAPDELSSFAAGLLQAGAVCVVATLWSVKDHATCLLMVRFHQIRLSGAAISGASALREAARWLRTASREELDAFARAWGLPELSSIDPQRDAMRGVVPEAAEWEGMLRPPGTATDKAAPGTVHVSFPFPYDHPVYWAAPIIYGA